MRFCMSSGDVAELALALLFLRLPGEAYVHDAVSPRLVQLSQGWPRLHFSLVSSACALQSVGAGFCVLSVSAWPTG